MSTASVGNQGRQPISLRQKVVELIRKEIIRCQLEPGQLINEGDLAGRFQVSKTPVREALASLEQEHLLVYTTNKGFMVPNVTVRDIQEIFDARLVFETALFKLAVKNITPAEIDVLEAFNDIRVDVHNPASIDLYLQGNIDFHLGIAAAARNSRLYQLYEGLLGEAQRLIYLDFKNNNILGTWHTSHGHVIEALRQHDEARGISAIEEMIANGKRRMLGL